MEDELAVGIPDDPGPVRYHGRRRLADHTGLAARRRLLLVVAAVGAVLIGTSALATTLPRPVTLLTPATGTGPAGGDPAGGISRLGAAPSPADSPDPSPVTDPQPSPASSAPPGSASPTPTPTGSGSPSPVSLAYEAEAADLSGFVQIFDVADASGGEVVGLVGVHSSNHVLFDGITVDSPGEYELTLRYVSAPARNAELVVNGGEPATVEFPALGDWRTVGSVSVTVSLVAGTNEIRFGQSGQPAPALDRLSVERAGGSGDAEEPGDPNDPGDDENPGGTGDREDPDDSGDPGDTRADPDGAGADRTEREAPLTLP